MVKCLTPEEAREAILAVMPCFEQEFAHFAPVDSQYLSEKWSELMNTGALAYGLEVDGEWRGFLLGFIIPDLVSGVLQGIEYFWLVEKAFRGEQALQLLDAFETECHSRGAKWIVIGMSTLAAPEKRKRRYTQLGYVPHCESWFKRI
jgi:hypothetical protein